MQSVRIPEGTPHQPCCLRGESSKEAPEPSPAACPAPRCSCSRVRAPRAAPEPSLRAEAGALLPQQPPEAGAGSLLHPVVLGWVPTRRGQLHGAPGRAARPRAPPVGPVGSPGWVRTSTGCRVLHHLFGQREGREWAINNPLQSLWLKTPPVTLKPTTSMQ